MKITRTQPTDEIPVWRPVVETLPGGLKLDITGLAIGSVLPAASIISYDEITRVGKVVKSTNATAIVNAGVLTIPVKKGHTFKVGDIIAKIVGGKASAITAIDTSNALIDTITIGAALEALAAGDSLFQAAAASTTTTSAYIYPLVKGKCGLSFRSVLVEDINTIDVVLKGSVYARRIPSVAQAIQDLMPGTIFLNSK